MNEVYTRLAEMLKKEEEISVGTAKVRSVSPLVLSYNGVEIREGLFFPPEMMGRLEVPELPTELIELGEFLEELLLERQLSACDEVLMIRAGEESYILCKLTEA